MAFQAVELYSDLRKHAARPDAHCSIETESNCQHQEHRQDDQHNTNNAVRVVTEALLKELLAMGEIEKAREFLLNSIGTDPGWLSSSDEDEVDPRGGAVRRHQQLYTYFIMSLGTHTPRHRHIAIELFSKLTGDFKTRFGLR